MIHETAGGLAFKTDASSEKQMNNEQLEEKERHKTTTVRHRRSRLRFFSYDVSSPNVGELFFFLFQPRICSETQL